MALAFLITFTGGCAALHTPTPAEERLNAGQAAARKDDAAHRQKIAEVKAALLQLGPGVDPGEAGRVAEKAVMYPEVLAAAYGLEPPAEYSNVLILVGLRRRGMCYELAEDFLAELMAMHLRTFDLRRAIARQGHPLWEHNCVVITARDKGFSDGIVLDAWRNTGQLRWAWVKDDSDYPWKPKPLSDWARKPDPYHVTTAMVVKPRDPAPNGNAGREADGAEVIGRIARPAAARASGEWVDSRGSSFGNGG